MNHQDSTSHQQSQVIMLCGMTGSGKTTLAKKLEHQLSAVRFSIDEWMIKLYGHHMDRKDFELRMNIIKQLIWTIVKRLIRMGINVILDYGFWTSSERTNVSQEIMLTGGIPVIYFLNVSPKILEQRLTERNTQLSEGTFEITEEMLNTFITCFEPPIPDRGIKIVEIKSDRAP